MLCQRFAHPDVTAVGVVAAVLIVYIGYMSTKIYKNQISRTNPQWWVTCCDMHAFDIGRDICIDQGHTYLHRWDPWVPLLVLKARRCSSTIRHLKGVEEGKVSGMCRRHQASVTRSEGYLAALKFFPNKSYVTKAPSFFAQRICLEFNIHSCNVLRLRRSADCDLLLLLLSWVTKSTAGDIPSC